MAAGSKFHITGSSPDLRAQSYTVVAVQNATQLTIAESVTLGSATATFANVGLRIVKTTGTGTVSFTTSYEYAVSQGYALPPSTGFEVCGHTPVTVATNTSGNTCRRPTH